MKRISKGQAAATTDGLTNVVARIGVGAGNALSQGAYTHSALTQNRNSLEAMYQGSWIVGKVIDCVAEDMTRAGIVITGTDKVDELQSVFTDQGVWNSLTELGKWARLYGGAAGVIMIDGQNLATPLRTETITKDAFKGVMVFDRWRLQVSPINPFDMMANGSLPEFYTFAGTGQRIHHTRILRQIGTQLPYNAALRYEGWGASVIERMYDRVMTFDSATMGAANLLFKAHLRTVQVEGLREILGQGGKAEENLVKMFKLMQILQTNEGLTLLDSKDTFATHAYSFAGLSDTIDQFGQQLAGASGIPLVRLFGQSPAGLNATGDGDIRNYYDNVASQQESRLRASMERLLDIAWRSRFGTAPPETLAFTFAPLWQLGDVEKATIAKSTTESIVALEGAGIINRGTALKEAQRSSLITGLGTTITDEEIKEAEEEPPMPTMPEGAPLPGEPAANEANITKRAADAWARWFKRK